MTQEQALKIMKTGVNVYLTGSAGSGKTFLLNKYINYLKEHKVPVAITASTGIAATHMNGMTIHGWSGIGIRNKIDNRDLELLEEKKYLWKRFENARVLIIDEVSMLHGYQLEMIDKICKRFKRNERPFGGLQLVLSGDFFQLPPIQKRSVGATNDVLMIYENKIWKTLNPAICYLTEQHRQEDSKLTDILNAIRDNSLEEMHYEQLNSRIKTILKDNNITKLYTHNINVNTENSIELSKIKKDEKYFKMISSGNDMLVEILKKSCLASEELILKIGAEIMCIKNNFEDGYVNGTRGKVVAFDNDSGFPIIELYNGKKIIITPMVWIIEENNKIKASITQLPLRLAWAITIHKSQGMSLDSAVIDLANTFTYGMGYVALSRVRTLSGINLIGFNKNSLLVNPLVFEFDQVLKNESFQNESLFKKLKKENQNKLEKEFILKMGGVLEKQKKKLNNKISTFSITKKLLKNGKSIEEIMKDRNLTKGTIINHIEKILEKDKKVEINHIKPKDNIIKLIRNINKKLKNDKVGKLTPIKKELEKKGVDLSFEEIRIARLFI